MFERRPMSTFPRDVRRGLARCLPFALVAGGVALRIDPAVGALLLSFACALTPLTLLEGIVARRPLIPSTVAIVVGLVWLFVAVGLVGCLLQFEYVRRLTQGFSPGEAIGSIRVPAMALVAQLPTLAFLSIVFTTHLLTRVLLAQEREELSSWGAVVRLSSLQIALVVVVVGIATMRWPMAVAVGVLYMGLVGAGTALLLLNAAVADRLESWWFPFPPPAEPDSEGQAGAPATNRALLQSPTMAST